MQQFRHLLALAAEKPVICTEENQRLIDKAAGMGLLNLHLALPGPPYFNLAYITEKGKAMLQMMKEADCFRSVAHILNPEWVEYQMGEEASNKWQEAADRAQELSETARENNQVILAAAQVSEDPGIPITPLVKMDVTPRGFGIGWFTDRYGERCSIQESSLATEDCLWLGTHDEEKDGGRMHLTKELAADLIALLRYFIETGHLPIPEVDEEQE